MPSDFICHVSDCISCHYDIFFQGETLAFFDIFAMNLRKEMEVHGTLLG